MVAANNEGIRILGAILLRISGKDSLGNTIETAEMVYVSDSTDNFYLSRHAMEQLGIIGPEFPSVGSAMPTSTETAIHSVAQKEDSSQFNRAECGCFVRTCPPSRLPAPICAREGEHTCHEGLANESLLSFCVQQVSSSEVTLHGRPTLGSPHQ